MTDVEVSVR